MKSLGDVIGFLLDSKTSPTVAAIVAVVAVGVLTAIALRHGGGDGAGIGIAVPISPQSSATTGQGTAVVANPQAVNLQGANVAAVNIFNIPTAQLSPVTSEESTSKAGARLSYAVVT